MGLVWFYYYYYYYYIHFAQENKQYSNKTVNPILDLQNYIN